MIDTISETAAARVLLNPRSYDSATVREELGASADGRAAGHYLVSCFGGLSESSICRLCSALHRDLPPLLSLAILLYRERFPPLFVGNSVRRLASCVRVGAGLASMGLICSAATLGVQVGASSDWMTARWAGFPCSDLPLGCAGRREFGAASNASWACGQARAWFRWSWSRCLFRSSSLLLGYAGRRGFGLEDGSLGWPSLRRLASWACGQTRAWTGRGCAGTALVAAVCASVGLIGRT